MAGFYPDVPAPRIPYDRDGTIFNRINYSTGQVVQLSQGNLQSSNDETSASNLVSSGFGAAYVFPVPMDIVGIVLTWKNSGNSTTETSSDSTNGFDGNWTTQTTPPNVSKETIGHRTAIHTVNWTNVKAFRSRGSDSGKFYTGVHLYGTPSSFVGQDTLRIWHPTLDEPLDDNTTADGAYLDWGDVVRGTTADRTFRIKNNSVGLTANSIIISSEALSDTSPTVVSQTSYSAGGAFQSTLDIGNLAPGAISNLVTVRKATDIGATQSVWTWRTNAEATSWT